MKLNIIRTQLLAAALSVSGVTLSHAADINVPADHATIQAAINAAVPGDTIIVADGTYAEALTVNKALTLRGPNQGISPNTGSRQPEATITGSIAVSTGASSLIVIEGFRFNGASPFSTNGAPIAIENEYVFRQNLIEGGSGQVAIFTASSLDSAIVTIDDNRFLGMSGNAIQIAANGTIQATITNNVIDGTVTAGINSHSLTNSVISGNQISNTGQQGIQVAGISSNVSVTGNIFTNNNTSNGADRGAVRLYGTAFVGPVHVTGNLFNGGNTALAVRNGENITGKDIQFTGNTMLGVIGDLVYHGGTGTLDATMNYWGSASGPGSSVVGDVNTAPYYTDANLTTLEAPVTNTTQGTYFATIQAAITAADAGDTIEVMAGTYDSGPISVNKAVTLLGPNAGLSGADPARGAEARIENSNLTVTAAAIIDGFEIHQTNNTADAILVQAAATISNSIIRRDGVSTGTVARGITTAVATTGYSITGNLFTGDTSGGLFGGHKTWNSGMYVNGGSGAITGNTFENCRTAINLDDFNAGIDLSGNSFANCGTYLSFGGTTPTSGQFTIAGNEFFLDWNDLATNWLPSVLFNNSNVATTFRLDVTGNTFGGIASVDLSNDQKFAIEARNYHRGRSSRNGVVDFVANEQVVMPGTTIASAVAAAAAGDTVLVGPGTFAENVTVGKQLVLVGNNDGVEAGETRSAESQVQGAILVASGGVTVSGFELTGPTAQIRGDGVGPYSNVNILYNYIHSTSTGQAVLYGFGTPLTTVGAENWVVSENTIEGILANAATGMAFFNITGLTVENNVINHTNSSYAGRRGINLDGVVDAIISGNSLDLGEVTPAGTTGTPWAIQISMSDRSVSGLAISGNTIANSYFGIVGLSQRSLSDVVINDNVITGVTLGLALNSGGAAPVGSGTTISNVSFTGNTVIAGLQALRVRNLHSAHHNGPVTYSSIIANQNVFLVGGMLVETGAVIAETDVDATKNYWGSENPDFGTLAVGSIMTSPWYADEALTLLVTSDNFENVTVDVGDTQIEDDLYIGGNYTVSGALVVNGGLTLGPNGNLNVVNGSLEINGSFISGTFTFFNSLGSVNFNDDVSIAGSAEGLIMISDVHVADGATVTVDGTLVIDGSVVDCQDPSGSFTLQINDGATFTMARTVFTNGNVVVESADTAIFDNRFVTSTIAVDAAASAARVFHNITDDLAWLTGAAVTTVDGWANVTDAANTENNLALGLDISDLPADRTQDGDGNIFIQPADAVFATLDVSDLQAKIAGVEVMLGYNTTLIDVATLGLAPDWDVLIDENEDDSTAIGLLDAAIGLSFSFADPEGSDADQTIGDVELVAGLDEGETLFFHRVKLASDVFGGETRLTTGGGSPVYLTPFTSNSAMITIDGTAPLIADPADYATITQFGDDVNTDTAPAAVTLQGVVDITAAAFDALAGIEDAKAVVTLVGPATYTATQTVVGAGPQIAGEDYTSYTFTYPVDDTTANGIYDVVFTVTDRSGNQTVETLGSILINKNQIQVNVELQGLVAGPLTRDVVFVFTDASQAVIETRTETVTFTGGAGTVLFTDVDGATARLSAKAATHLRKRLDVAFDVDGQATVNFTSADLPRGGDLNGDNVVNMLDYSILRFNWFTTNAVADITGSGSVQMPDYNVLQGNFYQAGDPQ